jgi:hypothetical protein
MVNAAACTSGFTWSSAIANTSVYGGTGNGAVSVNSCQTACMLTVNCVGIDWALSKSIGQQCFLILSTSGPRINGTSVGVTHYDYYYNNCPGMLKLTVIERNSFIHRIGYLDSNNIGKVHDQCYRLTIIQLHQNLARYFGFEVQSV